MINIATVEYKIKDNRRNATKYLEGLPKTTYYLLGGDAQDPRIPNNLLRVPERPELIILAVYSLHKLKNIFEDYELTEEDILMFTGKKKLYKQWDRRYTWGFPTDLAEYHLMKTIFDTDEYKLEREFLRKNNFFTKYCRLNQWEPSIYIYRRQS